MIHGIKLCDCGCMYDSPECPYCNRVTDKDRIEELEAELLETQDRANAFATKEYYTEMRAERAEAKLAKVIGALDAIAGRNDYADDPWGVARAALAELKGKDDE